MSKTEVGVSTNCKCGKTMRAILENIKAAGFCHIMFSERESDCSLEEGLRLSQELGLKIQSVHFDYNRLVNVNNFWTVGEGNESLLGHYIRNLKLCAENGIEVVCIHPASGSKVPPMNPIGIKSVKRLLEVAQEKNIKIAIENLGGDKDRYLDYLLDNIDSPYLGFCYDCGHDHNWYPDYPLAFMKRYGHRCFAIHLHDNYMDIHAHDVCRDLHLLPGDGKIDFTKVMRAIGESSYNDIIMLELKRSRDGVTLYDNMSNIEYLKEARARGESLAKMLKK